MDLCCDIPCPEPDRLETRALTEIQPHPRVLRLGLVPAAGQISALSARGDAAFTDPITVTHHGYILDGFARWTLARSVGRDRLLCLVRIASEDQALIQILRAKHRSTQLNDFNRIRLALELEEFLREQARRNQQTGARPPLSSKMTEARPLDVRGEIARMAGVSSGNVTNTKTLLSKAAPEVLAALAQGKIRIGRATKWLADTRDGGRRELRDFQLNRQMAALSHRLLSDRPSNGSDARPGFRALTQDFNGDQMRDLLRRLVGAMPTEDVRQILAEAELAHAV